MYFGQQVGAGGGFIGPSLALVREQDPRFDFKRFALRLQDIQGLLDAIP